MKEDHTINALTINNCPASARRGRHFIHAVECELDFRLNDSPEPDSTSTRKRRLGRVRLLLGLLFVAMCMTAYFMLFHRLGIDVTVQNTGNQPLHSVILVVTGNSYNLDDIPPNGTAQATVKCSGDSHLEIEFQDDDGQTVRLDAGGFFQPGYRGTIRLSIKDGDI